MMGVYPSDGECAVQLDRVLDVDVVSLCCVLKVIVCCVRFEGDGVLC